MNRYFKMNNNYEKILGVKISNLNHDEALEYAIKLCESRNKYIVTPNPEFLVNAQHDSLFKSALNTANLAIPDGFGIILASKILKQNINHQIPGIDFIFNLLKYADDNRKRVFLLGTKISILKNAIKNIENKYPNLVVCGFNDGYYEKSKEESIIKKIADSNTDILIIALGSPKQEIFIYQNINKLNIGIAIGCGGSLDVISGEVKRAPLFFRKLKLEWFYRLIIQPKRIVRIFKSIPVFLIYVIIEKFKSKN